MKLQPGYLLVVEDIPDTLELLDAALKFKGYRVATARNGQEALEVIRRERPAMVITDVLMPTMDGFGLLHRLRINPETRDLPVIFLTATYVAYEDRKFANSIGVTYFIEKPFDMDLFLKVVNELLEQPPRHAVKPLEELDFYREYRRRLQVKLEQKTTKIARDQTLLEGMQAQDDEAPAFKADLDLLLKERNDLQLLLKQIDEHLKTLDSPD